MFSIGLIPSDTGKEGGKQTGQNVSHYVEQGGAFARASGQLMNEGFKISWLALTNSDQDEKRKA